MIKQNITVRKKQTFFVKSWKKVKVQFEIYFLEAFSMNSKKVRVMGHEKNLYLLMTSHYNNDMQFAVRLFVGH